MAHSRRSQHAPRVVTYSDDSGNKINICTRCDRVLRRANTWPRNSRGREYCDVSHGLHYGACDLTQQS